MQLHELVPQSQGVRADTCHVGNMAELTLEAPPAVRLRRTANFVNMAVVKHNQVRQVRARCTRQSSGEAAPVTSIKKKQSSPPTGD